jgi:hypothetical protein
MSAIRQLRIQGYAQPSVKRADPGSISAYVHSSTFGARSEGQRWLPGITAVAWKVLFATSRKQRDLSGRTYSILVGALGAGYKTPHHRCKQRVAEIRTDLVCDLILWTCKYEAQRLYECDFTLCKGCDFAPGTSRRAAVDPSIYPLFCGTRVSPVYEVNSSLDRRQNIFIECG